jgi:hypothetical protein
LRSPVILLRSPITSKTLPHTSTLASPLLRKGFRRGFTMTTITTTCKPVGATNAQLDEMRHLIKSKLNLTDNSFFWLRYETAEKYLQWENKNQESVIRSSIWWSWFLGVWYLNDLHITHKVMSVIPTITVEQYIEAQLHLFKTKHRQPRIF